MIYTLFILMNELNNSKYRIYSSKEHELFSDITNDFVRDDFKNIKMNSLGKRSALSNNNNITFFNWESRWTVDWNISMSLFISVVFGNVMEIVTSDDNSSLHFSWNYYSFQDLSSDRDIRCKRAFFINVFGFYSFFRSLET